MDVAVPLSAPTFHEKENLMPPAKGDTREMPEGFAPSEFDVLVGWARQNFHHEGNRLFREIISENVVNYIAADTKIARGKIINDIVNKFKKKSPSGTGFLKLNPYTATWIFIGTDKAKDKVGHALRKAVMTLREEMESKQRTAAEPPASRKRKAPTPPAETSTGPGAFHPAYSFTVNATSQQAGGPGALSTPPLAKPPTSAGQDVLAKTLSPVGRDIFDTKNSPAAKPGAAIAPQYSTTMPPYPPVYPPPPHPAAAYAAYPVHPHYAYHPSAHPFMGPPPTVPPAEEGNSASSSPQEDGSSSPNSKAHAEEQHPPSTPEQGAPLPGQWYAHHHLPPPPHYYYPPPGYPVYSYYPGYYPPPPTGAYMVMGAPPPPPPTNGSASSSGAAAVTGEASPYPVQQRAHHDIEGAAQQHQEALVHPHADLHDHNDAA